MVSYNQLQLALKFLPLDKDIKDALLKNAEILIDFRQYLSKKYNISESDAETKIKDFMSKNFEQSDINSIVEIAYNFASDEGYSKNEEFKESILQLISLKDKLNFGS